MRNPNSLDHKVLADVLSVASASASTPYSKGWIRAQLRAGRLRGRKLGGKWVILRTALLDFLRDGPAVRLVSDRQDDTAEGGGA